MQGHLFVVQGDLTRLDTDAVVLPCDEAGNIGEQWRPFLPAESVQRGPWGLRVGAELDEGWHLSLGTVDEREVHLVAAAADLVALDVEELIDRVVRAVTSAARLLRPRRRRQLPLIALPLAGTGAGGLHGQRGRVVGHLIPALLDLTRTTEVDIALVLHDRRDYAAVQAVRGALERGGSSCWGSLSDDQRTRADALGTKAAHGELSLFIGSGVSLPLGLPDWHGLLALMANKVRPGYTVPAGADLLDEAAGFVWLMGDAYERFMREKFDLEQHALGHALLAALNVGRMVTTNYDPCLELALDGIHGSSYEVLTRSLATGGQPWLLKLHGDIREPKSLVLTRAEYDRLADEGRALHGIVESLMLTSHVMFVGYSLVDHDFGQVAEGVKRVRDQATDAVPRHPAGTALALSPEAVDAEKWHREVDVLAMGTKDDLSAAARNLEIFLDRVAWASLQNGELAGEYLLDPRFDADSGPGDVALRNALQAVVRAGSTDARHTSAWPKVARLLDSLGWDGGKDNEAPGTGRGALEALALEVARCPLIPDALDDAGHPCHDVVCVQPGPESERQVPEAWAGALETARVLFISSNPSISEAQKGDPPHTAEAYPRSSSTDEEITEFITRRFDPYVRPAPHVSHDHHLRIDGTYAPATPFWSAIRARAVELLGAGAEPFRDYAMTEVVHCKSRREIGVQKAASVCADRYLERVVAASPAAVLVVVGQRSHVRLTLPLELPTAPYVVERHVGGRDRLVVFLPHPNAFEKKTFAGVYPDRIEELRAAAGEASRPFTIRGSEPPNARRGPRRDPNRPGSP